MVEVGTMTMMMGFLMQIQTLVVTLVLVILIFVQGMGLIFQPLPAKESLLTL